MLRNVNNFAAAKVASDATLVTGLKYNYLIDLLSKTIKILNADLITGLVISPDGTISVDTSLYQPRDTALDEIAAAYAPSLGYFLVSDGADSWTVLSTTNVKSLLGISSGSNGESNWRFV